MALLKTAHRRTPCSKPTRPADKKPVAVELELLIDPEAQLADRDTALAKLRAIVEAKDETVWSAPPGAARESTREFSISGR